MRLKIPIEAAIEIITERKDEIWQYNFDPQVWKDKTQNDLREIFELGDNKWLQISGLQFTSYLPGEKHQALEKGKRQADEYLTSYIERINKYAEIHSKSIINEENLYKEENKKLSVDLTNLYDYSTNLLEEKSLLLKDINNKDLRINYLENNTVQLDDITLEKIAGLIKNLPIKQTVGLVTTFFTILGFTFYLGTIFKENHYLKSEYIKQVELDNLNKRLIKSEADINKLKNENKVLTDSSKKAQGKL